MPEYEFYEIDRGRITTDATIAHYGVKGMHWGVRRTPAQLGRKIKTGAKEFAKMQVGQTDRQKAERAKWKKGLQTTSEKAKAGAKEFAKFQVGQTDWQKAGRAKTKQDIKNGVSATKSVVKNIGDKSKATTAQMKQWAKDHPEAALNGGVGIAMAISYTTAAYAGKHAGKTSFNQKVGMAAGRAAAKEVVRKSGGNVYDQVAIDAAVAAIRAKRGYQLFRSSICRTYLNTTGSRE